MLFDFFKKLFGKPEPLRVYELCWYCEPSHESLFTRRIASMGTRGRYGIVLSGMVCTGCGKSWNTLTCLEMK